MAVLSHQLAVAELVTTAVGFNVTVILYGVPAQPLTAGVTTYTTDFGFVVVLVRVSVISAPVPVVAVGVTPVTVARLQLKVAVLLLLVEV